MKKVGFLRLLVAEFRFSKKLGNSIINLIIGNRYKYFINKVPIKCERCHHSMRMDAHIDIAYICF